MIFWKYYTKLWEILFILPLFIFFYLVVFQNIIILNVILFLFIQLIVGTFLKYYFFKDRPQKMSYYNFFTKVMASSFPSMHSANTFLLFLFSIYYLTYIYSIWFFGFWFSIAYSRVTLEKHFYIDIFSGMVLSTGVFFLFLSFSWNLF